MGKVPLEFSEESPLDSFLRASQGSVRGKARMWPPSGQLALLHIQVPPAQTKKNNMSKELDLLGKWGVLSRSEFTHAATVATPPAGKHMATQSIYRSKNRLK